MLNAAFKVHHVSLGNRQRDVCANKIKAILSKTYTELNSETVYLKTFADMDQWLSENPFLKVNRKEPMVEGGGPFPPNSGLVGIWASNYVAYKEFLKTDKDVLFLFEDDALVSKNFAYIVEKQISQLPPDWDVFTVFVPDDCLGWYNPDYDIPGYDEICRTYQDWSCAGYAITKAGAQKAVDDIEKNGISDPIDWYLFNAGFHGREGWVYFNTYSVKPSVYRPIWLAPVSVTSSIPITTEMA